MKLIRRAMVSEDLPAVIDNWVKSWVSDRVTVRRMPRLEGRCMRAGCRHVVKEILEHGARVRVACLDEDPTVLAGWVCHEGDVLHYVFVDYDLRRKGIARWLVSDLDPQPSKYTFHSSLVPAPSGWVHDKHDYWQTLGRDRRRALGLEE